MDKRLTTRGAERITFLHQFGHIYSQELSLTVGSSEFIVTYTFLFSFGLVESNYFSVHCAGNLVNAS